MKRMVVSETLANPNKDHLNEHIFQNSHMFASEGRKSLNETEWRMNDVWREKFKR